MTSPFKGWVKIVTVVCILAVILIAVALYSGSKQKLFAEHYSRDLQASLQQAREVKCDLEEMMLNTITLSRELVDGLEVKTTASSEAEVENIPLVPTVPVPEPPQALKSKKYSRRATAKTGDSKIRVYEMAEELGMNTRDFMQLCKECGFAINHHMNVMSEEQIQYFRQGRQMKQLEIEDAPVEEILPWEDTHLETTDEPKPNPLTRRKPSPMDFTLEEINQAHPYIAVRMLSEQGFNQKEIAQILDRGQGEVSLILNLSKRKQAIG